MLIRNFLGEAWQLEAHQFPKFSHGRKVMIHVESYVLTHHTLLEV